MAFRSFVVGVCVCVHKETSWGAVYFYLDHRSASTFPPLLLGVEALTFSVGGISEPCDLRSGPLLLHRSLTLTGTYTCWQTHTRSSQCCRDNDGRRKRGEKLETWRFVFCPRRTDRAEVSLTIFSIFFSHKQIQTRTHKRSESRNTRVVVFVCRQHLLRRLRFRLIRDQPSAVRRNVCVCVFVYQRLGVCEALCVSVCVCWGGGLSSCRALYWCPLPPPRGPALWDSVSVGQRHGAIRPALRASN